MKLFYSNYNYFLMIIQFINEKMEQIIYQEILIIATITNNNANIIDHESI